MPEISRFRGIKITMNFNDHNPAHFHVEYAGQDAMVRIDDLVLSENAYPPQVRRRIISWASLHQDELREAWNRREREEHPGRIPPLE